MKGYVIEINHPRRYDLPLWPEITFHFVKTKKEINSSIKRNTRPDVIGWKVYKATCEKMEDS